MTFAPAINPRNINSIVTALVLLLSQALVPLAASAQTVPASGGVVISQLQTGDPTNASQEMVMLYNNGLPVDVSNWCLIYSSVSDVTQTQLGCLVPSPGTKLFLNTQNNTTFATTEFAQVHFEFGLDMQFKPGIAASGGHIKLVDASKNVVDTLGWGAAVHPEGTAVAAPAPGFTLQRKGTFIELQDTNNNAADFVQGKLAQAGGALTEEPLPDVPLDTKTLLITELLPDPDGADAGREFIELYNPHDTAINLKDYILMLGPSFSKSYQLPDVDIQPNSYLALSDAQTGIVLPNSSASIQLLTGGTVVSQTLPYNQPGSDIAWAYIDGSWHTTFAPTPGTLNTVISTRPCPEGQIRSQTTGYCRNADTVEDDDAPALCQPDQERNPETGRCRKIGALAAALAACKPGQSRSLETGRCRSILAAVAGAVICKPNQTRNPDTGRCKNNASDNGPKPCEAGQERSKETGRCRKTGAGGAQPASVQDVASPLIKNNMKWWFVGASGAGSIGYAGYEWRREALGFISRLKH